MLETKRNIGMYLFLIIRFLWLFSCFRDFHIKYLNTKKLKLKFVQKKLIRRHYIQSAYIHKVLLQKRDVTGFMHTQISTIIVKSVQPTLISGWLTYFALASACFKWIWVKVVGKCTCGKGLLLRISIHFHTFKLVQLSMVLRVHITWF